MCGIAGIYIVNNPLTVKEETLVSMRDSLISRGPDDKGLYISKDKKLGLGFRRLSIIDLSKKGNQPMSNEDKSIYLVFNGEIYNFQELKEDLIIKGHHFKSRTDSEVIIHLYEEKREKCLDDLNGMFAFVIWDEKQKKLFAARDRIGIKPFYYYFKDGIFLFGSEIKAILKNPLVKREPDLEGISHYLTFASTPAPFTLFKDIKKLPAAHYLTLDNVGHLETKRYWSSIQNTEYRIPDAENKEEFYIQKIRSLLEDSIQKQMVSDVPFGCFLSGGIDSSTNAVLMSKAMGKPVETFSISYKDYPEFDEFKYSRKINELLKAKSHEARVGPEEFLDWIDKMADYSDDPNGDWVCFPVHYLAKMFKEDGVKMGQVGEGSDELFNGYDRDLVYFKFWKKFWRYLEKLPKFIKIIPYAISKLLPKHTATFPKELLRRLSYNKHLFYGGANAFTSYDKQFLLSASFKKQIPYDISDKVVEDIYQEIQNIRLDFLQQSLYLELNLRLPELLLMRVDKMTSMNSIEARVPYLDHRLVELAFSIPQELKLKNNTTKYILKKAVEGIIPEEIIYRKKKGFGAPVSQWLRENEGVRNKIISIIKNSKIQKLNLFDYEYIDRLLKDHLLKKRDNSFKIWNLTTLSLWADHWLE
ncbi:MAG TPA: asparagine synthase (glutamine-hydrolyzing) [Candidatus Paceibacterota bacterium]|nr:asparagine synthase (glutamine-hydrolyzing) [Candidatus Paceibacterota bacterium]